MFVQLLLACAVTAVASFSGSPLTKVAFSRRTLNMVATAPPEKKLQKVELIKLKSNYLVSPLQEELGNGETKISSFPLLKNIRSSMIPPSSLSNRP